MNLTNTDEISVWFRSDRAGAVVEVYNLNLLVKLIH